MRIVILYSAMSLDGFIARTDGSIDWLGEGDGTDYGYSEFYDSIDTTLTGHNTYRQVLTFGEFPYTGKENFVFGKEKDPGDANPVTFVPAGIARFVRELKARKGKDIWLVGGGQINAVLLNEGLIDQLILFMFPLILGEGIPLFSGKHEQAHLKLMDTLPYKNGVVRLRYNVEH